jgi:hypothetical protein
VRAGGELVVHEHDPDPATPTGRHWSQAVDERAAAIFWLTVLSIFASVIGAVLASLVHLDPTQVEAGLVGAFLGSSPIILMPLGARAVFGKDSGFAKRECLPFRALTVLWGTLIICSRLLHLWPGHPAHTSSAIAIGGLVAAILASWFWPYLPAAARTWARQQLPFEHGR